MGEKRKHGSAFQVGPAHLPDGTRKRKADRIKQALIDRAKIKQDFAKIQRRALREEHEDEKPTRDVYEELVHEGLPASGVASDPVVAEPHPDRKLLIHATSEQRDMHNDEDDENDHSGRRHERRWNRDPYANQVSHAQAQREEEDRRRREREDANRERQAKIAQRDKMHRMINKAKRPTVDGKRKLGRESAFLLEKVKHMMQD